MISIVCVNSVLLPVLEALYQVQSTKHRTREMEQATGQDDLKKLIKESIREVLREERLGLCEIMIPHVSKKELNEIRTKIGSPADYRQDDFTDMTDWVKG
jgi:hypothetical protein